MQNRFKLTFQVLALTLAVLSAGCFKAEPKDNSPVLATFEGGRITRDEYLKKMNRLPRELKAAAQNQKKAYLEELVDERFLEKAALDQKLDQDPDVRDTLAQARRKILVAKLVENKVDNRVTVDPDEAKRFYDANRNKFMTPLTFRASHILLKTEEEAQTVYSQIMAGADFEQLAREKSIHRSGPTGGDIGFFQKGKLIPEFEEAASQMKKGDISAPVKSQFGWHVIKLTDRVEPSLKNFESVKALVEKQLINEKRTKLFKEYIASLRAIGKITIDEKELQAIS